MWGFIYDGSSVLLHCSPVLWPIPCVCSITSNSATPWTVARQALLSMEFSMARLLGWVAISFSNAWKWKVKVKSLSRVWLFVTPWTAAYQAPPSMGFSRQKYWSGVPLPSALVPWLEIKPMPAMEALSLNYWSTREVPVIYMFLVITYMKWKYEKIKNSASWSISCLTGIHH